MNRLSRRLTPLLGLGLLLLVGTLVVLAAPRPASPASSLAAQGASHLSLAPSATNGSVRLARQASGATPQATDTPGPVTSPTPVPPTPPPTDAPTPAPTDTPTLSWQTVASYNGAAAGIAGTVTVGPTNVTLMLTYSCQPTTPNWAMQIAWMSTAGSGASQITTTCDGTDHTMGVYGLTDNPGGSGTYTFTVSPALPDEQVAAWTLSIAVQVGA